MPKTDREYLKTLQQGQLATTGAANALGAVQEAHTVFRDFPKVGTENAATNVASTLMFVQKFKGKTRSLDYLTGTNVAASATDYVVILGQKRTNGGSLVTIARYNTHTSAQGAITANISAKFVPVANSDSDLAANDSIHYEIQKLGAGQAVAIGTFTLGVEET